MRLNRRPTTTPPRSAPCFSRRKDYDSTDPSSKRAYLSLWSPKTGDTTATLAARDPQWPGRNPSRPQRGYLHLGGYLGGLTGRATFQAVWWENVRSAAHEIQPIHLHIPAPAKYGSYKAVATVDHRGDDWALIWSTVSDCTASGWLIWVSTGPKQVVTDVNSHWNYNTSTGVVSNLSINVNSSDLFNGTKNYYLNTIGFLKK